MSVPNFGLRLEGEARLQAILRAVERAGGNLLPVFAGPIDKSITLVFRRQWASRGAFGGRAWPALRASTQRSRVRRGGNRGGIDHPLWDTGRGKASFEKVGPDSFRTITRTTYERGSTLFYMSLHQTGYTIRQWGNVHFRHSRTVPARPPVPDPIPGEVVAVWTKFIVAYLESVGPSRG